MSNSISLYLPEIEQHVLGLLLNDPSSYADMIMLEEKDFGEVRQPIFRIIKMQLDSTPPGSVAPVILTERLRAYGKTTIGEVDSLIYLEGLQRRGRLIDKKEAGNMLRELKMATVRRGLIEACDKAKAQVIKADSFEKLTEAVTGTLTSINTEYYKNNEAEDIFGDMIEIIEDRGNQQKEDLGYVGVLPSLDKTIGPLIHPGSFCNISARSGAGKSSFGFFYSVSTAELFPETKLLWLDAGEMTKQQLQFRAAASFSKGRVPLWALRSGMWRKHKEWTDIIRGEIWPRVKALIGRIEYRSVGGMSAKEKVNFMRRHYYNKVGRDGFLIIVDDYLKGMESLSKETKEYQSIGYYTSDVKSLVTDEINAGFMTFTQSNRLGISKGKKEEDIVDNDSVVSISDRIKDNCTTNFLMRFKTMDQLAKEKNAYGNIVLKNLKTRDGLGRDFEKFIRPIKLSNGGFADDYFNLEYHSFYYRDMGLHSEMLANLGHTAIDLSNSAPADSRMP